MPSLLVLSVINPFRRGGVFLLALLELVKHHELDFRVLLDLVVAALGDFFKCMPILLSLIKSQTVPTVAAASFV